MNENANARQQSFTLVRDRHNDAVLVTDLLRRAKEFELAMVSCKKGLELQSEKDIRTLLEFQQVLIERKDIDAHTMEEARMYFRLRALGLDDT
jgi:hypothetical protein